MKPTTKSCHQYNREKTTLIALLLLFTTALFSCTKLDTQVHDKLENFWQTPGQIAAGVAPAYTWLRNALAPDGLYALLELSSDEMIVPTRGGDWNDNALWRPMWFHTWSPSQPIMENGWQFIYTGIAKVNLVLQAIADLDPQPLNVASIQAELKTVRAYYYLLALDLFGNVPIVEGNENCLKNSSRAAVFAYVEKEIKNALPNLSAEVNGYTYGRATQWFAQAMLAKLYINAQVYAGAPRWADCINACDAILQSKRYALEKNFFDNFAIANDKSRENIFSIPFDRVAGLDGFYFQGITLHYDSGLTFGLQAGGFNGHCSPAAVYNQFDSSDVRRRMFLVGQQYVDGIHDSTHMQYDQGVNLPLSFDPDIETFSSNDPRFRMAGARCAKWEFNKEGYGNMSNDFAIYRLADIILLKAEAQYRSGDAAGALKTINQKIEGVSIRSRAGMPDFSYAEMNADGLLAEREREFSWEGVRRNDMIRLGHFTDARKPEKGVSEKFRILYPIPEPELAKNPCLMQNPGY